METNKLKTGKPVSMINRLALKLRKPYAPVEKAFKSKKAYSRKNKNNERTNFN